MNFDFVNLLAHLVLICTLATLLFSVVAYVASRRKTLRRRAAPKPPPPPAEPERPATPAAKPVSVTRVHRVTLPGVETRP